MSANEKADERTGYVMGAPPLQVAGSIFVLLTVAGCSGDLTKIIPSAPGAFSLGISQYQTLEETLITEFQNEDRTLRYLSQGRYSCGNPRSKQIMHALEIKDPKKNLLEEYNSVPAWNASVAVIDFYSNYLKQIVDSDTADEQTIKDLAGAVKSVAAMVPPVSAYGTAIAPIGVLLVDFRGFAARGQLSEIATIMTQPLTKAVNHLVARVI